MRPNLRGVFLVTTIFLILIGTGLALTAVFLHKYPDATLLVSNDITPPSTRQPYIITIEKGDGPSGVIQKLKAVGIAVDERLFYWSGKMNRVWSNLKVGEYELKTPITVGSVFKQITSGISIGYPLTITEGENLYEIADKLKNYPFLSSKKFLEFTTDQNLIAELNLSKNLGLKNLEGYLFPNTYTLSKKTSEKDLVRMLIREANRNWTNEDEQRAKEMGWTRHQVVILASIVEKETGAPEERPLIASVFFNRLRKKMRLQSDPTTIYGIWHRYRGNLKKEDLLQHTPYNTYSIPALPIGPISNPGKESIQAVLHPSESEYLFFVSKNDGTHEFTTNLKDHLDAVKRFQINSKAREGKSWRDLQKNKKNSSPSKENS